MKYKSNFHPPIRHTTFVITLLFSALLSGCALPRIQLYQGMKRPDESICVLQNHPWVTSLSIINSETHQCIFSTNKPLGMVTFGIEPGIYEVQAMVSNVLAGSASGHLNYNRVSKDIVIPTFAYDNAPQKINVTNVLTAQFEAKPNQMLELMPDPDATTRDCSLKIIELPCHWMMRQGRDVTIERISQP